MKEMKITLIGIIRTQMVAVQHLTATTRFREEVQRVIYCRKTRTYYRSGHNDSANPKSFRNMRLGTKVSFTPMTMSFITFVGGYSYPVAINVKRLAGK